MKWSLSKMRFYYLGLLGLIIALGFFPVPDPPYGSNNTGWQGTSTYRDSFEAQGYLVSRLVLSPSLSQIGDPSTHLVVVVGGHKPYLPNEIQFFLDFVLRGGHVLLYEDFGFGRTLATAFGMNLSRSPVVDTVSYQTHPHLLVPREVSGSIGEVSVVLNQPARVQILQDTLEDLNSPYSLHPLLNTSAQTFEDLNLDGRFDQANDRPVGQSMVACQLSFEGKGSFTVVGDAQLPTNDMVPQLDNELFLALLSSLYPARVTQVVFEDSHKLWLPIGQGLNNNLAYLYSIILHSFLFVGLGLVTTLLFVLIFYRKNVYLWAQQRLVRRRQTDPNEFLPTIEEEVMLNTQLDRLVNPRRFVQLHQVVLDNNRRANLPPPEAQDNQPSTTTQPRPKPELDSHERSL